MTWIESKNITNPLLNIGEMLWLLDDHYNVKTLGELVIDIDIYKSSELCDVLWKEIKYIL